MKKTALALLLALTLVPASVFAADLSEGENLYLVLENISNEEGKAWLVEDINGSQIIFRYIGEEEIENANIIAAGTVLAIKDNGISTRSIPPQMQALTVRDLTAAYYNEELGDVKFTNAPSENPYTNLSVMPVVAK